ncbi:MAG: hypothetical protein KDC76_11565 [Bacteroidetes bacterium]|nr:hypothetical protein [Bacteroidota bacterium]
MDWQQIIFIILGIIYFLFRNNGDKEQTKKKPQPKRASGGGSTTSLEEILRELTGKQPKSRKQNREPEAPVEYEPLVRTPQPERIKESSIKRIEVVHLDDHEHIDHREHLDFDLRQAVINDAILNRPQW